MTTAETVILALIPILITAFGTAIYRLLKVRGRITYLYYAKIDCIIHANKNLNGVFGDYGKQWGALYEAELQKKINEKQFVEDIK